MGGGAGWVVGGGGGWASGRGGVGWLLGCGSGGVGLQIQGGGGGHWTEAGSGLLSLFAPTKVSNGRMLNMRKRLVVVESILDFIPFILLCFAVLEFGVFMIDECWGYLC